MGETSLLWDYSLQRDIQLLDQISSINLACGFHAGDAQTMHVMVDKAKEKGVAIGAHPSYPDKERFGRVSLSMQETEIYDMVLYQLGALQSFLHIAKVPMHHVKPHGALYNDAATEKNIANAIARAVYDFNPSLILYGLHGSELITAGRQTGLRVASEAFADRKYCSDGRLCPRSHADALINDVDTAVAQAKELVLDRKIKSREGVWLPIEADTICVHGDGPHALELCIELKKMLAVCDVTMKAV
jgi:UPF0271 protein